jgi:NADH-quinone oxidoreductase subunit L
VATTVLFATGGLALIGFPWFSGWYSKDAILSGALTAGQGSLFLLALLATLCTAAYLTRMFSLVFLGVPNMPKEKLPGIHESPPVMIWPMVVLAFFSLAAGMFPIRGTLEAFFGETGEAGHGRVIWLVTFLVLATAGIVFRLHSAWRPALEGLTRRTPSLREALRRQLRFDDLAMFVGGAVAVFVARLCRAWDTHALDRRLDRFAEALGGAGYAVARLQSGRVQTYALSVLIGLLLLASYLWWGGG